MMLINPFIIAAAGSGGGDTDEFYSSVSMLFHMDGADQSTAIVDEKGSAVAISGSPKIAAIAAKFGSGGLQITSSAQRVGVPGRKLSGMFTLEFFLCFPVAPPETVYYMTADSSPYGWFQSTPSGSQVSLGFHFSSIDISSQVMLPVGTYHHIAVSRDASNVVRLFVNGNLQASKSSASDLASTVINLNGNSSEIGPQPGSLYLDEVRLTEGVCRYTGSFTPPTAPFPSK